MKKQISKFRWLLIAVVLMVNYLSSVAGTINNFEVTGDSPRMNGNTLIFMSGKTATLSTTSQTDETIVLEGTTKLILNGVDISTSDAPPIEIAEGANVTIELAEGSTNTLVSNSVNYAGIHVPV